MDNATLNRKLAEALGWTMQWFGEGERSALCYANALGERMIRQASFSPATDRNHLADYVLVEVKRRGLSGKFITDYFNCPDPDTFYGTGMVFSVLTASPAILAAAALKVLQEAS